MPKHHPAAIKAAAFALFASGMPMSQISDRVGVKEGVIKSWSFKEAWATTRQQTTELVQKETRATVVDVLREQGERTRGLLAGTVEKAARVASQYEPTNLVEVGMVGEAIEPLARTAKLLHGYGDEKRASLVAVGVGRLLDEDEAPRAIDCQVSDAPASEPGEPETVQLTDSATTISPTTFTDEAAGI